VRTPYMASLRLMLPRKCEEMDTRKQQYLLLGG
jgi:hypothetical protein